VLYLYFIVFYHGILKNYFLKYPDHNKWYQSRVPATMNHVPATTNSRNYEEIRKLVLQLQKDLKMYTDNVAVNVAKLQESTERMKEGVERTAIRYRRMEIVLTEVEDALKEEEVQEQLQIEEVPKLEATFATNVPSDFHPKEVEVCRAKAQQIKEFQLVTTSEENAIIRIKEEIGAPDELIHELQQNFFVYVQAEHKQAKCMVKRRSKKNKKGKEELDPEDQLEQNEHLCPFASMSAAPKLMQFFRVLKHRWRWKIALVAMCLEGLESIVKVGEAKEMGMLDGINVYAQLIDEGDGLDKIENLQSHDNVQ